MDGGGATSGNNRPVDAVTFPLPQDLAFALKQTLTSLSKLQEGIWSSTLKYLDSCLQTHTHTHIIICLLLRRAQRLLKLNITPGL